MKNYLYHRIARQAMLLSSSVGTFNVPIELNNKIYIDRKKYVYIYHKIVKHTTTWLR